ncbi:Mpv17/PMP22 family protein [Aspergillus chevalieri]|uniref:Integral membrane protein n=1 Tax=Aspergillus chevalieri TaxID=182096 RepID=A0A7R7ZMJ1_ASPCH|nr:uncharacterized protein ACHE_30528S [Aspergillus chevalieri]BCR86541.1 hypothetical protein ACHE_30528S [Aspergillus chevalieri]
MRPLSNKPLPSSLPIKPRQLCRPIRQQRRYTPEPNKKPHDPQPHTQPQSQNPSFSSSPPHPQPSGTVASSAGASPAPLRARSLREVIYAGPLGRLGRSYARVQERRPYATQLCSSVVVYLCGDLSAQVLFPSEPVKGRESENAEGGGYDPWRTMRHLTVGVGSSIPSYNWFMFLHNNFNFPSKFLSILTKVCVQQAVFTPVFNTYFFSVHSLLSGASLEDTWERLKKALPVSVTNSVKLWPAVTAFSFMYVPPQFRNVFSGIIAVGWQTYLSWLNQKAAREVEVAEMAAASASASVTVAT